MTEEKFDVFKFMALRAPEEAKGGRVRRAYISDEYFLETVHEAVTTDDGTILSRKVMARALREPFRADSPSQLGALIHNTLFCGDPNASPRDLNAEIVAGVLQLMQKEVPACGDAPQPGTWPTLVRDLQEQEAIQANGAWYMLPTRLEQVPMEFPRDALLRARALMRQHAIAFDKPALIKGLREIFGVERLWDVVLNGESHNYEGNFAYLRTTLFELLYKLFILRRLKDIDLQDIMSGLQVAHALEYLAADALLEAIYRDALPAFPSVEYYAGMLVDLFPELDGATLDKTTPEADYRFLVNDGDALAELLDARPVIHPVVAELGYFKRGKFNGIKPYLGDLKVVKQWLTGYRVGEIAHIINVMSGEEKIRTSKVTERTEDVSTLSSESSTSATSESQSNDRYEVKTEAEQVIRNDLNVTANASFTYNNPTYGITTTVGAGFAYARSAQDSQRASSNYARDVMDRAVNQVEKRTVQTRSITKVTETIETDRQKFTNTENGAVHVSGIYRWLDKSYQAQLYNYGKRWMFEFVVPEPAALFVEARLQATALDMKIPRGPTAPKLDIAQVKHPTVDRELQLADIDENTFNALATRYDLSEFTFPQLVRRIDFINPESGQNLFTRSGLPNDQWTAASYTINLGIRGYRLVALSIEGYLEFIGRQDFPNNPGGEAQTEAKNNNTFALSLDGREVIHEVNNGLAGWNWTPRRFEPRDAGGNVVDLVLTNDTVPMTIGLRDANYYNISIFGEFSLSDETLARFRIGVYNKIRAIEEERVRTVNEGRTLAYETELADYLSELDALNTTTINDLIQGRSEAFNAALIAEELKRQCISLIAQEFDFDTTDDLLPAMAGVTNRPVPMSYPRFNSGDTVGATADAPVRDTHTAFAQFSAAETDVSLPAIHIEQARMRGRLVQFLEQAFEWEHIAYLFYPYFWARQKNWLELMNRLDYTDNNMTAFLKAGSARVLIAVTPGYHDAVMYYLATREPWLGGATPIIGDPLFIPVNEEIRAQQDDLQGAVPEGDAWTFTVPTALLYLQDSSSAIPADLQPPAPPPGG